MGRIKIYTASNTQGVQTSLVRIILPSASKGALRTIYDLQLCGADGDAIDITGASITGTMKRLGVNTISNLDGVLAIDDATTGKFSWTVGSSDVGIADTSPGFEVQFKFTIGGSSYISYPVRWAVVDAFIAP